MNPFTTSNFNVFVVICFVTQLVTSHSSSVLREQRRIPENIFKLKEMTTTADSNADNNDDVFAIPIDDFRDYWYGRRLKKRSLLSIDETPIQIRSEYQPWGGKRAKYADIFQLPKGFNPNGGKRSESYQQYSPNKNDGESRKRMAKTFQNWAGKRSGNGKAFVIWGGKKRSDSFRTWGGKRSQEVDN